MSFYIVLGFQSGRSLKLLEADCGIYYKQMKEHQTEHTADVTSLFWQIILNLTGRSAHSSVLRGDVMVDSQKIYDVDDDQGPILLAVYKALQSRLCVIFGEHEKGAALALGVPRDDLLSKVAIGHPLIMGDTFTRGVCLFAMARKTKRRKFARRAKEIRLLIKSWGDQGNPDVRHYLALLDAEMAALKGKIQTAEKHFQDAVITAARGGFIHDAALASERYGEFLLNDKPQPCELDKREASYRFGEAVKYYSDWGADSKVASLQNRMQKTCGIHQEKKCQVLC
jgi:histidine kinase